MASNDSVQGSGFPDLGFRVQWFGGFWFQGFRG